MLSDVLFDALRRIEKYQKEFEDSYGGLVDEIAVVKTLMLALQTYLDAPAPLSVEHDAVIEGLREAIKKLDMSPVVAARERMLEYVRQVREENCPERTTVTADRQKGACNE